ncbi:hypothetical protein HRbin21_00439 [bacterium HR21]|jgi:hypothetical protein|nr:hypothetical protein HRbin21_00439 [bacterium HR21]
MREWVLVTGAWLAASGCAFWHMSEQAGVVVTELTPEPGILLAENPVFSPAGDLVIFLPRGWFALDLGERAPAGTVVVGVNPEYTLALTVVLFRRAPADTAGQYDLLELARQSFARHQARSAGALRLSSDFNVVRVGMKSFVVYHFSDGGRTVQVAVFVSSLGTVYELALFPLSLRAMEPPTEQERERMFYGVLRALQF